jgi:uncharacterized membrane protein
MRLIRLLKRDIAREAAEWVDENLITENQAEQICQRYGIDFQQTKNRSFAYTVLVGLGFLFIGLALITLIGGNWEDIPRAVRMGGLILLTLGTQCIAFKKRMDGYEHAATWLFFLGNLFYGASIILIAQIYHLGEHMPDGIFWWALGCLPIALLLKNPWLMLQSLLLSLIWFFTEIDLDFFPTLFPLFIVCAGWLLIRGPQNTLLFLTTLTGFGLWVEYSLASLWRTVHWFNFHAEHLAVSIAMFICFYQFSQWLGQKKSVITKDYGTILAIWSLRFGLICMLILSFEDPWKELIRAYWDYQLSMFVVVGIFAVVAMLFSWQVNRLRSAFCLLSFYVASLFTVLSVENDQYAVYFQIIFNLALIATGIWLIVRGIHSGISHYFFLGVSAILLTAFMRYVDLIGDYVGGALLFAVFAALLLGAAKYWKSYQIKGGAA